MRQERSCLCDTTAETSRRVCPNCQRVETTAVPFTFSGKDNRVCTVHDAPVPVLTELSGRHFKDERGYTTCADCGWVFTEFDTPTYPAAPMLYMPDHYGRLRRERHGELPNPRRRDHTRIGYAAQRRLARDAAVLGDAEILCGILDVRGDARACVLAATEAYYTTHRRKGGVRVKIEAVLIAIAEQVCGRLSIQIDSPKAVTAFNVNTNQLTNARESVGRWFATYWSKQP